MHYYSGLGALISTSFARAGANIAINYFNRVEPAEKVKAECEEHGVKAVTIKAVSTHISLIQAMNPRHERGIVIHVNVNELKADG